MGIGKGKDARSLQNKNAFFKVRVIPLVNGPRSPSFTFEPYANRLPDLCPCLCSVEFAAFGHIEEDPLPGLVNP